jgi:cytochrome c oxidase subunit 2
MKLRNILLTLTAFACIGSGCLTRPSALAEAAPKRIDIATQRFMYTPGEITLKKGEPVVLVFTSSDVTHGIHFKELGVDTKVSKGKPTEVSLTPTQTGDFVGHCSVFCGSGHGSMALTIHVVD